MFGKEWGRRSEVRNRGNQNNTKAKKSFAIIHVYINASLFNFIYNPSFSSLTPISSFPTP